MKHVTANGTVVEIKCMDDSHLNNTIKFLLRKMQERKNIIYGSPDSQTDFVSKIKGTDREAIQEAKDQFVLMSENIGSYLHEASIRGFDVDDHYGDLRGLLERSARVIPSLRPARLEVRGQFADSGSNDEEWDPFSL